MYIKTLKLIKIFNKLLSKHLENKARCGIGLGLLEENMINNLYIHHAKLLNLNYQFLGSVLEISNAAHRFLQWRLWTEIDSRPLGEICGDKGM